MTITATIRPLRRRLLLASLMATSSVAAQDAVEPPAPDAENTPEDSDEPPSEPEQTDIAKPGEPPRITVLSIETSGGGCPPRSLSAAVSPAVDAGAAVQTIDLSKLATTSLSIDPSVSIAQSVCELRVNIAASPGYAAKVQSVHFSGQAFLDEGVTGQVDAAYRWLGRPARWPPSVMQLNSGSRGSFMLDDTIHGATASLCGRQDQLVASTVLSLRNPSRASGSIQLDLLSSTRIAFALTKCE